MIEAVLDFLRLVFAVALGVATADAILALFVWSRAKRDRKKQMVKYREAEARIKEKLGPIFEKMTKGEGESKHDV